jgi:hypothetical protein
MPNIFIPTKIKIGYQTRTDTSTGRLAYVTYYDDLGVLRKEKSWEDWRSKDIEPVEVENKLMTGMSYNSQIGICTLRHFFLQFYLELTVVVFLIFHVAQLFLKCS